MLGALAAGWSLPDLQPFLARTLSALGAPTSERSAPSMTLIREHGDLVGRARVIDGDTIEIHGQPIRLNGIDAPERDQTCEDDVGRRYSCGEESARQLSSILRGFNPTNCLYVDRDAYGRVVADCYRADGANIASELVRSGYALDWPRHSGGRYDQEQRAAMAAAAGIWRGDFEEPWTWRQSQRSSSGDRTARSFRQPDQSGSSCRIKGNINDRGERIYHVPGQRHYEQTTISVSRGERMFCSEGEARAAGWRRSRV